MKYVEENEAAWSAEQLAAAEAQIEEQKREWELNRQTAIEAEEARLREEEEADSMVYAREPCNEVKRKRKPASSESSDSDGESSEDTDTDSGESSSSEEEEVSSGEEVAARVRPSAAAPARKTRSRGTVNINLWTLDDETAAQKATKRKIAQEDDLALVKKSTVRIERLNGTAIRRDSSDVDVVNNDANEWQPPPQVPGRRGSRRLSRPEGSVRPSPPPPPRLRSTWHLPTRRLRPRYDASYWGRASSCSRSFELLYIMDSLSNSCSFLGQCENSFGPVTVSCLLEYLGLIKLFLRVGKSLRLFSWEKKAHETQAETIRDRREIYIRILECGTVEPSFWNETSLTCLLRETMSCRLLFSK